jgi:hypothetical protein
MKKIGEYTTRGQALDRVQTRITLFDGRFDTGYRVIRFTVLSHDTLDVNAPVSGMLATEEDALDFEFWDLSDQRQIGWAANKATPTVLVQEGMVDPDNFIVEDLFFVGKAGDGGPINYLITMEKYETTEWMGALALVRNSGQDV